MPSLIGIDIGLTYAKTVVFDVGGTQLAVARMKVPQSQPRPRWVERDMGELWQLAAASIHAAVSACGRDPADIAALAVTAHGDGLYLLDQENRPVRPGILSLDSRAGDIIERWGPEGVAAEALRVTGQEPHASAPSALLAWIKRHEPASYRRTASILACKDWLRFCLTGTVGTDHTEASTSFTDYRSQAFSAKALAIFGLDELSESLPQVSLSHEVIGGVTREAAAQTGLIAGTPVAAGLHDVTASALGVGGHEPGLLAIIAGTYSINEIISTEPAVDARWYCRSGVLPGTWNNMAISPASSANYEWFLETLCRADQEKADREGTSIHHVLAAEIDAAFTRPSAITFHPFLFGSPYGSAASASLFGLRGWHDRGDILKGLLEGVVFNHRAHIDALRSKFGASEARIAGGVSRNPAIAQLFADALDLPMLTTLSDEAGALGAALCAGTGIGLYDNPISAARRVVRTHKRYLPDGSRKADLERKYDLYCRLAGAMRPLWPAMEPTAELRS
ncbi:FGGY-family carbohydrate kinase [Taklimakanibacter lacteus]|uniref:FGGY-family carbohydrate kinase n=1 Tax=Taklimakanibacter lacteus TaxID=2268456 RepID=UPI000E65FF06